MTDHNSTPQTIVVNFRDVKDHWNPLTRQWDDPRYVYIGRLNVRYGLPTSRWGNPFRIAGEDSSETRNWVIEQYAQYMRKRLGAGELDISELRGKVLVCWCAPRACHGDWLAAMANAATDDASEGEG